MEVTMKKLITLVVALIIVGCSQEKATNNLSQYSEYEKLRKQYNELAKKNAELLNGLFASNSEILGSTDQVEKLDFLSHTLKNQVQSTRDSLGVYQRDTTSELAKSKANENIRRLKITLHSLNIRLSGMENQYSRKNTEVLSKLPTVNFPHPEDREVYQKSLDYLRDQMATLRGLRTLYEMIENDIDKEVAAVSGLVMIGKVMNANSSQNWMLWGIVEGKVLAPNKVDPVSNALVYLPLLGNEKAQAPKVYQPGDGEKLACGEPREKYLSKTCSNYSGEFTLKFVPEGEIKLKVKKGDFEIRSTPKVTLGEVTKLQPEQTTLPSINSDNGTVASIAVVLGTWDHIESILGKIGLADLDQNGQIKPGTEKFTKIVPERREAFFQDLNNEKYRLVIINCQDFKRFTPSMIKSIQKFVENGGRLFVTDRAYDIVEQVFPWMIRFVGDTDSNTPGPLEAAKKGGEIREPIEAFIDNYTLSSWLAKAVKCGSLNDPKSQLDCIDKNGKVKITGFQGGWAVMEEAEKNTEVLVKGTVMGKERPLSVMFNYGQGRVFYSSYHTVHGQSALVVSPQERILQYFIFEVTQ
jgi:hypothetical protein